MQKKLSLIDKIWNFFAKPFYKYRDKHPAFYSKHRDFIGSTLCGMIGGIITYLLMSFMPYLFGQNLAEIEILLPKVEMHYEEITYSWSVIGFPIRIRDGIAIIGGGLGYSLSYYIANVISFCVSFWFMRRFHQSKQNPYKQFFIGFTMCFSATIISNMINGLWLPILFARLTFLQYNIIVLGVIGTINFLGGHVSNLIIYKDQSKLNRSLTEGELKKKEENIKETAEEINKKEFNLEMIEKSANNCYKRNYTNIDINKYKKYTKRLKNKSDYIGFINEILKIEASASDDGIILKYNREKCICPLIDLINIDKEKICDCMIKKEEIFFSKIFDKNVKINLIESLNRSGNDCKIELIIVEKN